MIRPVNFAFNEQTAVNNAFQVGGKDEQVHQKALDEFNGFVSLLKKHGVNVVVIDDSADPHTPDSIFPNNWVSFHDDGTVFLYPMFAVNRRSERKPNVLSTLREQFKIGNTVDLTSHESSDHFLEGTGSMVLDRDYRIAYACRSPRTHEKVLNEFCEKANFQKVVFSAVDQNGQPIYHTNVMMCVADRYVTICLDSIANSDERKKVEEAIRNTKKDIIPISFEQMNHFAGNMLQVSNDRGEKFLVMSSQAFESLDSKQVEKLSSYNKILHAPLTTIESNGGGSARCMMAEIHLPAR